MKKLYSLLVMMLVGFAASWAATSTLTFTAKCGGSGTADDGVAWTVTSDGTESDFDSNRGIHYGTGKAAVQYIKLSTSGITGTITQVVVNASTASGVSATASVTVGGAAFGGDAQALSTTATDYTFTGSASGAIEVTVTKPSSANKALYVLSVAVTYTEGGGEPAETYAITYNQMENGSVTGPAEAAEGATVTLTVEPDNGYQLASLTVEDENDVAISVSNNKFTMPAGPVYVSATFEEIPTLQSIAEFIGSTGTQTFGIPVVALGQNGSYLYIVDENNTAGLLVYGTIDQTYSFGDVIPAGFSGTYSLFRNQHELASPAGFAASTGQATLTPMEASISDISLDNFGRYAVLRGATISGTTITVGSETVALYNRFDVTVPTDGGTYDIFGVISMYNSNAQFLPISFEAVDVPEPTKYAIEIDAQIVNGTVEADKAEAAEGETVTLTVTPATGYELEAITVLDANLEEVTVSNNAFTMPASNVLVSATFVEQGEQPQPTTEGTANFVFSTEGGNYYYASNTAIKDVELSDNNITLVFSKNSGNDPMYYSSDHTARAYSGSTLTFTAPTGSNITAITCDLGAGGAGSADVGTYNSGSWTGSANSVVITLSATTRFKSITVTYAAAEPVTEEFYITATPAAGTYEGPQTVFLEGHNGDIFAATYNIDGGQEQDYDAQTGVTIDSSCTINLTALDGDGNEATLEAAYVITFPELEVTLTPEAGTYYEAQNVKVAVANVYDDGEYLVSYKIGEGAEQEYDAEAGINITESCTLTISVEATYQSFEQSYEYVITEAPEILTENATIVFKGGNAESNIASLEALESYVEEGYALISAAEFDAVYSAKVEDGQEKDGIRINKGSYQGSLKLTLANAYAANKLIVKAMPYGTDAAKMLVNGTQFNMESGAGFADYEVTLDGSALNEITIAAAQKSTCRFYVKSISIICEEPVATTDMAEVTEAGDYVVTVGNVVAFDDEAQTVYTTDGQENWLPVYVADAELYAQAKAAATLSQIAGSFDASKTAPLFTATAFTAEGEFVENSQEIYTFDLSDDQAVLDPKAGQVIKIKGIWDGRELRAYSGANGGNRGRSFTVLGATDALAEGTAYSIPVAVTLKEEWDEEASTGAPKRVAKDGDAAFQNLQGKIVGGADMIEGVSTAVTDLNSDKAISGVQYVNVAGQVSAEPFEGVNIVVTTYVDGSRSAVKVVR